jgi:hypothetical protein
VAGNCLSLLSPALSSQTPRRSRLLGKARHQVMWRSADALFFSHALTDMVAAATPGRTTL